MKPEVDEPPQNYSYEKADGAEGGEPFFWHTKNLVWLEPASDFDWKRWRCRSHHIQAGRHLKSVPPLPRPYHLKFWRGPVPLWRMKFLHPSLKHITLREMTLDVGTGHGEGVKILKRAEGFVRLENTHLSYLYKGWCHLIWADSQGMLRTRQLWHDFPTLSATTRFKGPREGAPRILKYQRTLRGWRIK